MSTETDTDTADDVALYVRLSTPVTFHISAGQVAVENVAFFKPTPELVKHLPPLKALNLDAALAWVHALTGIRVLDLGLMPLHDWQTLLMSLMLVLDLHVGDNELAAAIPTAPAMH